MAIKNRKESLEIERSIELMNEGEKTIREISLIAREWAKRLEHTQYKPPDDLIRIRAGIEAYFNRKALILNPPTTEDLTKCKPLGAF